MAKFPLKLTADVLFQYLFSSAGSEPGLLSFINAVRTDAHCPPAQEIHVRNPFNPKRFLNDKLSILDVKATDSTGRTYDIEMQTLNKIALRERILLYWSRIYNEQIQTGEEYERLNPVVSIVLTQFNMFPELKDLHNMFHTVAVKQPECKFSDHFQLHVLELAEPKLSQLSRLYNPLYRWLEFLYKGNEKTEEEMDELIQNDSGMKVAYEKFRDFTDDEYLRELAVRRYFGEMDRRAEQSYARNEGHQEGRQEGLADSLIQLLNFKFPEAFTPAMEAAVRRIPEISRLNALFAEALKAENLDVIEKML